LALGLMFSLLERIMMMKNNTKAKAKWNAKVKHWEQMFEALIGEDWDEMTPREIAKMMGHYQEIDPDVLLASQFDGRGREYMAANDDDRPIIKPLGRQYVATVCAEVRYENDNLDEVIQYFTDNDTTDDVNHCLSSIVWVEPNDEYSPERDWEAKVFRSVYYETTSDMLRDAETRMSFIIEAPSACYETTDGCVAQRTDYHYQGDLFE